MSAEVIQRGVVERHRELMAQLATGVVAMCTALWSIRAEKTYKAQGCASFSEFLARAGISETTGRLYANVGPALAELQRSGHADLVKHAELLKPIHLMIARASHELESKDETISAKAAQDAERIAKKQADVVRLAAQVARRGQQPLTAQVIEMVAEKNFHWLPDRKRKAAKKKGEPDAGIGAPGWEHPIRTNVKRLIDAAAVLLSGTNAHQAVHYARVHRLPGFMDLAQWFVDVLAEAEKATPDFFEEDAHGYSDDDTAQEA